MWFQTDCLNQNGAHRRSSPRPAMRVSTQLRSISQMPHFTMQELEALAAKYSQQGRGEERPQSRHVPYQPPPLKRDIQRSIYNVVYSAGGAALTRRQIADAIGIKKTTWLEAHIERLVQ